MLQFYSCIRTLLANRLVVLVTHQVQFALQADKILVLKDVSVISELTLSALTNGLK